MHVDHAKIVLQPKFTVFHRKIVLKKAISGLLAKVVYKLKNRLINTPLEWFFIKRFVNRQNIIKPGPTVRQSRKGTVFNAEHVVGGEILKCLL